MVQCDGYRCLAYRDEQGKWRSVYGHQELPSVLAILSNG